MKDKIYIFGHKNPDTDSVCSAICLSYLKNKQGYDTEPRILSSINEETKYILNKFHFDIPPILDNVKLQVSDIDYHQNLMINYQESIYDAFFKMQDNNVSSIPIIDHRNHLKGLLSMKDIAKKEINHLSLTIKTYYDKLLKILNGQEILKFNDEILGNISTIEINKEINNKVILITNNVNNNIQNLMTNNVSLIIISDNKNLPNEDLIYAKNKKINLIYTKMTTYEVLLKIRFANLIQNYLNDKQELICIHDTMEINELNDIINRTKHSYYPIVDNQNKCLGVLKLSDLREIKPKNVILVDHNEIHQSVEGLEEAKILGIIDHHKLGNIGTSQPIEFRNMSVGSTCTIIYKLFEENKIKLPIGIASLLLSGIISDTLNLKSPTTTLEDIQIVTKLKKITNININNLSLNMLKANDIVKSKSMKEIIYSDFKLTQIDKKNIAIGQITTLNAKAILKQKDSYIKLLNKECQLNNYHIFLLAIVDILKKGSYFIFNHDALNILNLAFDKELEQGIFMENIISRKKQIIPNIIKVLE